MTESTGVPSTSSTKVPSIPSGLLTSAPMKPGPSQPARKATVGVVGSSQSTTACSTDAIVPPSAVTAMSSVPSATKAARVTNESDEVVLATTSPPTSSW